MQALEAEGETLAALDSRPELLPGLDFYFTAYRELRYDRPIGMTLGPIPWSSVVKWGELYGLDIDDLSILEHHIRAMEKALEISKVQRESKGGVSR